MLRYRLRTLLILLAVGPPALAALWLAPGVMMMFLLLVATAEFVWRNTPRRA